MIDMMWLERVTYDAPVVDVVRLRERNEMISIALYQSLSREKDEAIAFFASIGSDD